MTAEQPSPPAEAVADVFVRTSSVTGQPTTGRIVLQGTGHFGHIRQMNAGEARRLAAELLNAADVVDQIDQRATPATTPEVEP